MKKILRQGKDISRYAQATCFYRGCKSKWVGNNDQDILCRGIKTNSGIAIGFAIFLVFLPQYLSYPLIQHVPCLFDDNHPNIIVVLI